MATESVSDAVEWVKVALRWVHVFAAILWIGHTYLFNFMEKSLEREDQTPENVRGRLWMVHGGGFYFVEKQKVLDGKPRVLHWFKWESAATWLSGALLLALDYYHGRLVVEPEMSFSRGVTAGLVCIFGGWVVYDLLVTSPIGKREEVLTALGWVALVAITYVLGFWLAARAVYIHVGAMIGTIMAANVWMRILPSQRKMLAAIADGKPPEASTAATGPLRSKQNSYMVIPLVFLMISNHYPTVYGSAQRWLYLGVALIVGWGVARLFRGETRPGEGAAPAPGPAWHAALALGLLAALLAAGVRYRPSLPHTGDAPLPRPPHASGTTTSAVSPAGATGNAVLAGVVRYEGAPPAPESWGGSNQAECRSLRDPVIQLVRVEDGKLADVFVYVASGLGEGSYPVPETPYVFDQKGCEFSPRVFGVMAGQPIQIGNSDKLLHNVRSPSFNKAFPYGAKGVETLSEPSVMTVFKCDVHPWMRAYIGVMEHPFFATTGEDGAFRIEGLPEGDYQLAAWHEKLGTREVTAKATEKDGAPLEIVFSASE